MLSLLQIRFYSLRLPIKLTRIFNDNSFNKPSTATLCSHSNLGSKGEALSLKKYWEACYNSKKMKKEFDWLLDSNTVSHDIISQLETSPGQKILDLGCGNSSVSQKIIKNFCCAINIHCLDYVPSVIDHQVKLHLEVKQGHPSSCFVGVVGEACALPYRDNMFDIIIDKGTMDSLLKDNVKERRQKKMTLFLRESLRVLAPGGCFLQFTDEDPDIHQDTLFYLLCHLGFQKHYSLSCRSIESPNNYDCYVYSIKKLPLLNR